MQESYRYTHEGYDIIGDIHGCCGTLEALLEELGYSAQAGIYRHPERRAIFIGDLIDRGPRQRDVVDLVRRMVDGGTALAVMGNHEFNALAWYTPDRETGDYLRPHSEKNRKQHQAFLEAYANDPDGYDEALRWFRTLPLWLDLGDLKVVHACWHKRLIERLAESLGGENCLTDELLVEASRMGSWQFEAIETILKGKELPLPAGAGFHDKEGNLRHNMRVRWWDRSVKTYREAYMGPESARTHIPDDEVHGDHLIEYAHDAPPVFLGHYWLEGVPAPLAPNIACLDYSVAKPGGKLVAYRWSGEQTLASEHFVWIDRVDE